MKIFHIADIHLASKMEQFGTEAAARRNEIFDTFKNVILKAKEQGVKVVLLAGDVFDQSRPTMGEKKKFYQLIEDFGEIDFLYLRGNHDTQQTYSKELPNLKTFTDESWTSYSFGNVVISGRELTGNNLQQLHEGLTLDNGNYNIVMLHGTITGTGNDKDHAIDIEKFRNKNIDYMALGHIHKRTEGELDKRGKWAYSGNLEGRGYDETGAKGYNVIDTNTNTIEFVRCCRREVCLVELNLTNTESAQQVIEMAKEKTMDIDRENILKIELKGRVTIDMENIEERIRMQIPEFYHLKIKNLTKKTKPIDEYIKNNSLVGEFARLVENDYTLSEDDKNAILQIGIENLTDNK